MKIQWKYWENCLSYLILDAIKHQTNCPVFLSLFYSKPDFHTSWREAAGGRWPGPCCIVWLTVMTNKLVMKAKFSLCCQNFTLNETYPGLTSIYLLMIPCKFPISEQHSVCCSSTVQCLHVNFSPALNNSVCRVNFCLKIFAMLVGGL